MGLLLRLSCMPSHATGQAVSHQLLTMGAWFSSRVVHVKFVVDRVALGQVFVRALNLSPANYSISDPYPFLIRGWYSRSIWGHNTMQYFCVIVYSSGRKMKGNKCKLLLKVFLWTGMDHWKRWKELFVLPWRRRYYDPLNSWHPPQQTAALSVCL